VKTSLLVPLEIIKQDGFSNLRKRKISYRDLFVCLSLHFGDSIDDDDVDNMMETNLEDESNTYNSNDGRERS
jgi:uncharacterized Fe-S cluster-containing protein